MNKFLKIRLLIFVFIFSNCNQKSSVENGKVDTYEKVKNKLKGTKVEKIIPKANIEELEMEVNNGGFNQYFFNSSGQNCYETLKELKRNNKPKTAKLLKRAIILINPNHIPEDEFLERLRKREVEELYNEKISSALNKLDEEFYKLRE